MTEANKELVRRSFEEIFNHKNLGACDELMTEDFVEHGVAPFASAPPGRVNGPAAMRSTAEWLQGQFPDLHMTIEAIVAEGDLVVCRIVSEGTNLGPLNPMVPATGKRFSARQSHWFRIEGNKLAEHWATRDDLSAMLQLGVVQPPGKAPA
jgi:predicted ester cyclase